MKKQKEQKEPKEPKEQKQITLAYLENLVKISEKKEELMKNKKLFINSNNDQNLFTSTI